MIHIDRKDDTTERLKYAYKTRRKPTSVKPLLYQQYQCTRQYLNDEDGNCVKSVLNGVTTYYVGNHFEWTGSTTSMVRYYYAGGQRVAMRQGSSTLYFLLGDHLGSTAKTYNATTGATTELRYHPWGGTRFSSGTTPTSYQFTGQKNDVALSLYFYNARYYDPYLNRFIQADTIVPSPANPRDLNRYAYAANNPLSFIDPNGHQIRPPDTCGAICYTGTTGPYNVEYATPAAQPLTVGTTQSVNDFYWTTSTKLPGDAGVIMRYQTSFEAVPKFATVYAPLTQGPELQTVWRYESRQWTRSQETHFAVSVEAGVFSIGIDSYGGKVNPELGVGPLIWGGNELLLEIKHPTLKSGVEAGFEYGGAGDFFVITTGEKLNEMGFNGIQQRYVQQDSVLLGYQVYENYRKAWNVFWPRNLAQQRWTGFPYTWRSTEME